MQTWIVVETILKTGARPLIIAAPNPDHQNMEIMLLPPLPVIALTAVIYMTALLPVRVWYPLPRNHPTTDVATMK
jgi:hypothetical protein